MAAKRLPYLVSADRARELRAGLAEVVSTIKRVERELGVRIAASTDGDFLEVIDRRRKAPAGYSYVATIFQNRRGFKLPEVCRFLERDDVPDEWWGK